MFQSATLVARLGRPAAIFGLFAAICLIASAPASAVDKPVESSGDERIDYINAMLKQGWKDNEFTPSKDATDGEWVRRVFLDVVGRIPSAKETQAFMQDRSASKKSKLVTKLLTSDDYIEEYARNWTTIWTNILIGRTGGTGRRTLINREGMQQYLRRAFLRNKPYDEMAFELISANGSNRPGDSNFNGAVNFLLDNLNEKATPATAKISRIFLGLQVQCTQCHNHPFNNWKQDAFWSLNAFLRQARPLRTRQGRNIVKVDLEDEDFRGEGNDPEEAEIYYELRNGFLKVAYPKFIDGTKINPSGYVEDVNRRDELAKMVRKAPELSRAMVNRTWAHFLGYGFTKPIDDMGPHNAPSNPELLDMLSKDFATYGYDIKQLIRWITLSDAYALSSKATERNKLDDPTLGEKPQFSHFYLRQMSAEQLYESLIIATEAHKARGSYAEQESQKSKWLQQFSVAFGTDENDEATTFNGTIPQTLMMWNGDLISKATSADKGGLLQRVAADGSKNGAKVNYLYMNTLGRRPTTSEIRAANEAWRFRKGNAVEALQDVFWVLLNSNEFILNH